MDKFEKFAVWLLDFVANLFFTVVCISGTLVLFNMALPEVADALLFPIKQLIVEWFL